MRRIMIIAIALIAYYNSFGQNKMIVDKPFNGNTSYGKFSEHIDSFSELPSVIQFNIQGYLGKNFRNNE